MRVAFPSRLAVVAKVGLALSLPACGTLSCPATDWNSGGAFDATSLTCAVDGSTASSQKTAGPYWTASARSGDGTDLFMDFDFGCVTMVCNVPLTAIRAGATVDLLTKAAPLCEFPYAGATFAATRASITFTQVVGNFTAPSHETNEFSQFDAQVVFEGVEVHFPGGQAAHVDLKPSAVAPRGAWRPACID